MALEIVWADDQIHKFFTRLEECLSHIKQVPNGQKDSLRKPNTKEYQHSPQTTIFYSFDDKVVNILRLWANLKDPDKL